MDAGAWGLISVTWKGKKERQISKGPSLLCCPPFLCSEVARGQGAGLLSGTWSLRPEALWPGEASGEGGEA